MGGAVDVSVVDDVYVTVVDGVEVTDAVAKKVNMRSIMSSW